MLSCLENLIIHPRLECLGISPESAQWLNNQLNSFEANIISKLIRVITMFYNKELWLNVVSQTSIK